MLNIADTLHRWCRQSRPFALATVTAVSGSAPLPAGTSMAVDAEGNAVGSLSGGCVEGAVYDLCRQVLSDRGPAQQTSFGYSDDDAFAVGLTCGGELEVLVQHIDPVDASHLTTALEDIMQDRCTAIAHIVDGPPGLLGRTVSLLGHSGRTAGSLDDPGSERAVTMQARALLHAGRTRRIEIGDDADSCPDPLSVLVHVNAPQPRMLIYGAIDFAAALTQAGNFLGYRTTVCDARPVFATRSRFPEADEVVVDWPHRHLERTDVDARTAICVLTHDTKFDLPLMQRALALPTAYIGAMGSRRTHDERLRRLHEAGVPHEQLARLRSPIGLDLGARSPEETALSITAEIVAEANGGTGLPLHRVSGPIHRPLPVESRVPVRN